MIVNMHIRLGDRLQGLQTVIVNNKACKLGRFPSRGCEEIHLFLISGTVSLVLPKGNKDHMYEIWSGLESGKGQLLEKGRSCAFTLKIGQRAILPSHRKPQIEILCTNPGQGIPSTPVT